MGSGIGPIVRDLRDASAASALPTLTDHYGGVYFSYLQAFQLDSLLEAIRRFTDGEMRDTGIAAVIGAASSVVTSVGNHFAQPIRPRDPAGEPKLRMLAVAVQQRTRDVFLEFSERMKAYRSLPGAAHTSEAVCADYGPFLRSHHEEVSVAYADPPYTRDHYSRFYHVLETIALGDDPDLTTVTSEGITKPSRGLYRKDRHQSPFCIKTEAPPAFELLFREVRSFDAPLVLSYSPYTSGTAARPRPRLLTIEELVELASEHFGEVRAMSGGSFTHSKFNAHRLNGDRHLEAEQLLLCIP
jgi:hypothetical protein